MGPAILITLGTLFLLENFTRLHFGMTWPIFLIVIGGIKVLQSQGPTEHHIQPGLPAQTTAAGDTGEHSITGNRIDDVHS